MIIDSFDVHEWFSLKLNLMKYSSSIQYNTLQNKTILYNTIQYNTIQYNTIENIYFVLVTSYRSEIWQVSNGITTAEMSVKLQSDWKSLKQNLSASRLREIVL